MRGLVDCAFCRMVINTKRKGVSKPLRIHNQTADCVQTERVMGGELGPRETNVSAYKLQGYTHQAIKAL